MVAHQLETLFLAAVPLNVVYRMVLMAEILSFACLTIRPIVVRLMYPLESAIAQQLPQAAPLLQLVLLTILSTMQRHVALDFLMPEQTAKAQQMFYWVLPWLTVLVTVEPQTHWH